VVSKSVLSSCTEAKADDAARRIMIRIKAFFIGDLLENFCPKQVFKIQKYREFAGMCQP